ncbi:MAG: hypothetical protein LBR06_00710 [Bacteroidales bacterium]|nr:hypothetical protein [Bacteroidales bacterium]
MKHISIIILVAGIWSLAGSCRQRSGTSAELMPLNWDVFNREQLELLINEVGKNSAGFDASKPPYIVVDWDNTSIFLDIEEAVIIEMMQKLVFGATPELLDYAIRKDVPTSDFAPEFNNLNGEAVNIEAVATDIIASYRWLYANYSGLGGDKPLDVVMQSPHYMAFASKLRYLYDAIDGTFGHDISYPWVTYLFAGMNEQEVRALTRATICSQLAMPVGQVTWTTPELLQGEAGAVSVTWKSGLRFVPEMQNLYWTMAQNGFDIHVCSASFIDVVREIASNPDYGYNIPEENIIAMELERDGNHRILPVFREGYDQTQEEGKTKAIKRFLVSTYGYGPVFVAGDSEGDQNMMQDFSDTRISLIINRMRSPESDIGRFSAQATNEYGSDTPRYLLQGRDDNIGLFRRSPQSIKFGGN